MPEEPLIPLRTFILDEAPDSFSFSVVLFPQSELGNRVSETHWLAAVASLLTCSSPCWSSATFHRSTLTLSSSSLLSTSGRAASQHTILDGAGAGSCGLRKVLWAQDKALFVTAGKWVVDPGAQSPNQNYFSTIQLLVLIKREGNSGFVALFINSSAEKGTAYLRAWSSQGSTIVHTPLSN